MGTGLTHHRMEVISSADRNQTTQLMLLDILLYRAKKKKMLYLTPVGWY